MTVPALPQLVVDALRSAGATEEMLAAAVGAFGAFGDSPRRQRGRRRQYADDAARQRACRARHEIRHEIPVTDALCHEIRHETPLVRDVTPLSPIGVLRERLLTAAQGHVDLTATVEPIRALLDQGCDLEADILPTVAREVPELPRPLRNLGSASSANPHAAAGLLKVAQDSTDDAADVAAAIERTVSMIAERPKLAPIVYAGSVRGRLVRGFQFRIFYEVTARDVIIRNVRRTKRPRPWEGE
jgi:hypothetical protein